MFCYLFITVKIVGITIIPVMNEYAFSKEGSYEPEKTIEKYVNDSASIMLPHKTFSIAFGWPILFLSIIAIPQIFPIITTKPYNKPQIAAKTLFNSIRTNIGSL